MARARQPSRETHAPSSWWPPAPVRMASAKVLFPEPGIPTKTTTTSCFDATKASSPLLLRPCCTASSPPFLSRLAIDLPVCCSDGSPARIGVHHGSGRGVKAWARRPRHNKRVGITMCRQGHLADGLAHNLLAEIIRVLSLDRRHQILRERQVGGNVSFPNKVQGLLRSQYPAQPRPPASQLVAPFSAFTVNDLLKRCASIVHGVVSPPLDRGLQRADSFRGESHGVFDAPSIRSLRFVASLVCTGRSIL